jgi:geranylgeranyl diphosphate synthase type I
MDFEAELNVLKTEIEKKIWEFLHFKGENPVLEEFYADIRDFMLAGGKRLRPICMIQTYSGFTEKDDRMITASLSSEFLHAGSLVLDDAMDEDIIRHGKKTLNAIYADKIFEAMQFSFEKYAKGESWVEKGGLFDLLHVQRSLSRYSYALSSLASNLLFSLSVKCLKESGFDSTVILKALHLHMKMYHQLNEGQLFDVLMEKREPSEEEYLSMVDKKSGLLFAYPIRIAAVLAGHDEPLLDDYSLPMTRGFQIHDDILGTFGGKETGKPTDSDIKKGKRTLLVIKALEMATEDQRDLLNATLGRAQATPEEIELIRAIFRESGALDYCREKKEHFSDQAKTALESIPLKDHPKAFLRELADFVIERTY